MLLIWICLSAEVREYLDSITIRFFNIPWLLQQACFLFVITVFMVLVSKSKTESSLCFLKLLVSFYDFLDISIFIGARSDVGRSDWSWYNGLTISNPDFPPANSSICQDMTWPLSYDDGINLHPKPCESGRSYFVCQRKCKNLTFKVINLQ